MVKHIKVCCMYEWILQSQSYHVKLWRHVLVCKLCLGKMSFLLPDINVLKIYRLNFLNFQYYIDLLLQYYSICSDWLFSSTISVKKYMSNNRRIFAVCAKCFQTTLIYLWMFHQTHIYYFNMLWKYQKECINQIVIN